MQSNVGLARLLTVHAAVTLAAAVVLVVAPELIPSVVGIRLDPSAYLLSYLLAGAEAGFAVLTYSARNLTDRRALNVIVRSCVAFHLASALLEVYALVGGVDRSVWGNVAARGAIIALFLYYAPAARSSPGE